MFLVFVSNILFILWLCLVASPTFMVGVLSSHLFMLRRFIGSALGFHGFFPSLNHDSATINDIQALSGVHHTSALQVVDMIICHFSFII